MKVYFYTLGCKVNQYESQSLSEKMKQEGFEIVQSDNDADIIVVNSCTVTSESDRKTRQAVRRFKKNNPDCCVVLTGCMVQAFPKEAEKLHEADIVIGNRDVLKVINAINNYNNNRIFEINRHQNDDLYNTIGLSSFNERTRAFMKIQDGCDRFCTYCIIPFARGRVRSRAVADIKAEAERLANNGFCEIVLVGINLTSYGKGEKFNICDAVDAVCEVDGIKRVRLGSLEPDHITNEMLNRFNAQAKFCPQFHLSLHSG